MKLLIGIVWLIGGIYWAKIAIEYHLWYVGVLAFLSFILAVISANGFDKQLKK